MTHVNVLFIKETQEKCHDLMGTLSLPATRISEIKI